MTLTRREFILLAAATAVGSTRSTLGLPPASGRAQRGQIQLLALPGSVPPALLRAFQASGRPQPTVELAATADALRAAFAAGPDRFDLILTPAHLTSELIVTQQLRRLEPSKLPALEHLPDAFARGRRPQDPANAYSLPASSGAVGLIYRRDQFARPPSAWRDLYVHANRVVLPPDPQLVVGNYLRTCGQSPNDPSPVGLQETRAELEFMLRRARVAADPIAALRAGQRSLTVGPSSLAAWHALGFALPAEGTFVWSQDFVVPTGAPHPDLAHDFIDFALTHAPPAPLPTSTRPGFMEAQLPLPAHAAAARRARWVAAVRAF